MSSTDACVALLAALPASTALSAAACALDAPMLPVAESSPGLIGAPVKSLVTGAAPGNSAFAAFGLFGLALLTVPGGVTFGGTTFGGTTLVAAVAASSPPLPNNLARNPPYSSNC